MVDYYDRLETQLANLTERGAHRRRFRPRLPELRIRTELIPVAVGLLVVLAVGVVFLGVRTSHRLTHHSHRVGTSANTPAVIRNFSNSRMPGPDGSLVCDADLERPGAAPGATTSPGGIATVYNKPPTRYQLTVTAKGLKPSQDGSTYAVWLLPEVQTTSGGYRLIRPVRPELLGVIKPSVGRDGKLAAEGLLPQGINGSYRMLITLQPHGSERSPGPTVLEGDVPL